MVRLLYEGSAVSSYQHLQIIKTSQLFLQRLFAGISAARTFFAAQDQTFPLHTPRVVGQATDIMTKFLLLGKRRVSRGRVSCMAAQAPTRTRSPATTGSVKTAMTLTEKILANKTSEGVIRPGENVWVNVDKLLTHDVCGPGTFGVFEKEFGANAKVRGHRFW
jgi:hypothetical protein